MIGDNYASLWIILICLLTSTNVNFYGIAVSWHRQTQTFCDYISRIFRSFWIFWSFFRKLKQKKSMGSFIKENKVNFQKRAWSLSKRKTITRNGKTCTYLCIQLDSLECEIKLHSIVYTHMFLYLLQKHFQNQAIFELHFYNFLFLTNHNGFKHFAFNFWQLIW